MADVGYFGGEGSRLSRRFLGRKGEALLGRKRWPGLRIDSESFMEEEEERQMKSSWLTLYGGSGDGGGGEGTGYGGRGEGTGRCNS